MPESPDYLSLFKSLVPEETPEQKAARLLAERQARTPTITAATTPEQELEDYVQKTGSVQGYSDAVIGGQRQMDAVRRQMTAEADKAQYDLPGLSSSTGNGLQDVAKLYNKPLESMLRATGTPQFLGMVGEQIGEDVGRLTGTKADLEGIGRSIGEGVPRMIAGGAGLGVPGMMLDTGLQSLATTGDPLSAAGQAGLAGLTMGAAKVGGKLGERAVGDYMTKYMVGQPTNVADQLMNRYVGKEITQGVLPKIGGGVGAAAGAGLESELVRQVQEGPSNPFTVENVFSQAANAAVFSGIHAVGSLKSPRNLEAQGRLEKWFIDQMGKEREVKATPMPGETPGETQESNPGPIIDASLSGNDTHPQARKDYWIVKMDKAATVVDPMERAAAVSEMTDQILSTKNLNQISLTAGRLSKIKPPETMGELVDVTKRYNDLRDLSLRMIDERAASGEDVPSAAAVRQLSGQGLLPKMDLAWLKNEFGDAVERTLTGDDMMAFRVLSQRVMNHTLILARTAKEARAQSMTQASIESSGLSSDALDERNLTMGFVSAVNSVSSKKIRDALAERYIHHEQSDQQYGKGEADKFMEEVTDVVNKIIEGKTPEEVKAIDWDTAVAQVEKRVVQISETGEEVRPIVARDSRLSDYVATNDHGEYVKKVYGRPNRSQRELLAQEGQDLTEVIGAEDKVPVPVTDEANWQYDLGQEASGTRAVEPTIPEVKGGGTAPKGLYDPSLDAVPVERQGVDTQAMALQLKDNVAALDDKKAWFALAPELTTMRGTIDSRKRESVQPYAKKIIAAVIELGTGRKERGEQTGEAIGPAGAALLAAKGMPEMTFEKYRAWLDELMNARVNPKYRENIVKRLAVVESTVSLPVGKMSQVQNYLTEKGQPLLLNHYSPTSFNLSKFDVSMTGKKGGTDFGPGVYLDPGANWRDYVEETSGVKNLHKLQTYVKAGAKVFDQINAHSPEHAASYSSADVVIDRHTDGTISQVFVRDPKLLMPATQPMGAQVQPPTGILGASNTGNPQADLHRVYTDSMLTKGYTPAEIKQDITQAMQILSNFENPRLQVAAFDPRSAYRNLTPGQIAGTVPPKYGQLATAGMYSTEDLVRPLISLAMSHVAGDSPRELVRFNAKMSLVHELVHGVQYEPAGVYSEERQLARQQFENFAKALSPENRHAVLKVLADFAIPHEVLYKNGVLNPTIAGILRYGSNTGGGEQIPAFEMVNVASEILGVGMVMGGTKLKLRAEDIFNSLPTEAALFIKGEYRNIMDHLGAFGEAVRGLPGANASEVATWAKYVAKMVNRIAVSEEPAASLAKAQAIVAALDGKQFHGPARTVYVEELSVVLGNLVTKSDYSQVKPALNTARDLLFGPEEWHKTETTRPPLGAEEEKYLVDFDQPPPKGPKVDQSLMEFPEDKRRRGQVDVGGFWRWAGLFHQTMAHMETRQLPLAQDVSKAFLGLIPAQERMSVAMLKPFMMTDEKPDPNSPLVQMRQDKSLEGRRDNELVNGILKWQNANEKSGVVQQADGSWAADPEMAATGIGDVRGFLPQRVVGSVLAMRQVGYNMGQQLLSARIQSVAYRVAKLLMASQPKELKPLEYERTLEAAGLIVRGMVFDQQATTAQGLEQVLPPQREAVGRMLGGGLVDQLKTLNKMVTTRSDWWATEQRSGDHLVVSFDKNGVKHTDGAQSLGEARKMRADLQERGYKDISVISKDEKAKVEQFDSPEGILHHFTELEQKAMEDFVTKNPANLTPDQLALIEAYAPTPGAAVGEMLSKRGTNVYLKQRRGVPTAYGLDYIDSMKEYVSRIAGTVSRQMAQAHVELILSDSRLDNQGEFKTIVRQSLQAALTPNSEWQRAASTGVSSYFLGGNLSSAIVNGFDTVSMLPETLLSQGDATYNIPMALGHYAKGIANMVDSDGVDMGVLRTATAKLRVGQKLTPDETRNWVRQRAYEMKMLDRGQMHEVTQESDIKALMARAFGTNQKFPTLVDMAKDPVMRAVQLWMIMPRMVHSVNNRLSFEAGLEQAVDRGMGPQEALDHANKIRTLATFSGGKSNPTGAMAQMAGSPAALSLTRLSATMQSYAFGTLSKYMSHASNMITADENLTPLAKRQARQAFGYMLSTHMSMAGLMGVTGIGAAMALLNKYFDIQAEAGVRKGVQQAASVLTSDPSVQGMVTELAMNGAPNQLFGAAVGARIGMGNVMGLSSYEGFNMLDVVPGAAGGAAASVFKGLGYMAQGEPQQAIRSLVPAGLKNAVDMAGNQMKFGDMKFRGPTGQVILDPTMAEKGMYAAGLQPSRLAQARSLSRLTDAALKSQQKADAKKRDEAARQMLRGNLSPARELQQVANEAIFPRTPAQATGVMQSLADRASVLNSPQDPLASVSYAASPEARRILQTFPAGTRIPASEVDRAKTRIQLEAQSGVPVDVGGLTREMMRAQLVEAAMKKGMTRAEALKWVSLVNGP